MKRFLLVILILGVFLILALVASTRKGNLAVLKVDGVIFESEGLLRQMIDLEGEEGVRAVVVRIESPGGSIGASQEIFEGVQRLVQKGKRVVASMGSVAASGGYYVAAAAEEIFANPGTITGSIGVRMDYVNIEDLMRWSKVHQETLKSGRWKDVGSPTRKMDPEEKRYLEDILGKLHRQFKSTVAARRGLSEEKIDTLAQGQIYTGEEAKENGLVDELGNLQAAIERVSRMAEIEGKPDIFFPEDNLRGWIDRFLGEMVDTVIGKVQQNVRQYFFRYE